MVDLVFFFKQKTAYEMRISDWSSDVCSSDLIVPAHMRHLDGGIVPLDQPHSAGNPSESLMTAIFLTPLREQLHADANAKAGHAAVQTGFLHRRDHARHGRQRKIGIAPRRGRCCQYV